MMIIEKTYMFECPECHCTLEARPGELDFGLVTISFKCPICYERRWTFKHYVTKRTKLQQD